MKKRNLIFLMSAILVLAACNRNRESGNEVMYDYVEETGELSPELKEKIGSWAEVGTVCYGCVVSVDEYGNYMIGKPVKAKILRFKGDSVRMKALEAVSVAEGEIEGCTKMGLARGETWWETEGDLYRTREDAEGYLREMGLLK
jgi:hypothetical protein